MNYICGRKIRHLMNMYGRFYYFYYYFAEECKVGSLRA